MTWTEATALRTRCSRTWRDDVDTTRHHFQAKLGTQLNYPTADPDSIILDGEIDCTPIRIDNAQLDGWRVTQGPWHYALGQPAGKTDGWVGLGGRQGQHWLHFRLQRVGYLHWPTRAWDDIGGSPTYNRANLSRQTETLSVGPTGAQATVNVGNVATWTGIWQTPGGGDLTAIWRVEGRQLKEDITLNQAAREWIATNHPPATPTAETWFGFVYQLDVSDIPKCVRAGVLQDWADFADDGASVELRDAADHLLCFLPVSTAISEPYSIGTDGDGDPILTYDTLNLRKRFWTDDGTVYLLVGARVDQLNALHAGDVTFDPDYVISGDTGGRDTHVNDGNTDKHYGSWGDILIDAGDIALLYFDLSAIPADATCDDATLSLWNETTSTSTKTSTFYEILVANDGWPVGATAEPGTGYATYAHHTEDSVEWAGGENGCFVSGTDRAAGSIGAVSHVNGNAQDTECSGALTAADVEDWFGDTANYGIAGDMTDSKPNWRSSNHATAAYRPSLEVNYTEAGGVSLPVFYHHYSHPLR